jgi:hypothetical protein
MTTSESTLATPAVPARGGYRPGQPDGPQRFVNVHTCRREQSLSCSNGDLGSPAGNPYVPEDRCVQEI